MPMPPDSPPLLRERLLSLMAFEHPNRTLSEGSPQRLLERMQPPPLPPPLPEVIPLPAALRSMVDRQFLRSEKHEAQKWRASREGAHPDILEFEKRLITRMRKQHVPLFTLCCVRTPADQTMAYIKGHSRAKAGQSPHQYGMAVDIIHGTRGYDLHKQAWSLLGHIGKEISVQSGIAITWGGDWKFYDPAHWELKEWRTLAKTWPPRSL